MNEEIGTSLKDAIEIACSAAGHGDVQQMAEQLDGFLEAYSTLGGHASPTALESSVTSFYTANRSLVLAGSFIAIANLSTIELPLSIYPARMLRDLVRDVTTMPGSGADASEDKRRPSPSIKLLAKVQKYAEVDWGMFTLYMSQVGLRLLGGRWPDPTSAERALQWLQCLQPTWARVVIEARAEYGRDRELLKDAAVRRAFGWYTAATWLLRTLASPRLGPLRLLLDYLLGLISYFDASIARSTDTLQHRAARDALVLEVFSLVFDFAETIEPNLRPTHLTLGSHGQASAGLRKRLQRARLRSILHNNQTMATPMSDAVWVGVMLPAIEQIRTVFDSAQAAE